MSTISDHFKASAKSILDNQFLEPAIESIAKTLYASFEAGGKLELLNRYKRERRELPGITLTADGSTLTSIGNDYDYSEVFSKQVKALGQPGDCLMVITTSGNSANILKAVEAAHEKSLMVVALNGKSGGKLNQVLANDDINLVVKGDVTARIQEVHGLAIHCICELIDSYILD